MLLMNIKKHLLKLKYIFLKILSYIPIFQCLTSFSWDAHKSAFKKLFFLWVLTSLPIIFAATISPVPEEGGNALTNLWSAMQKSFAAPELFIYTASFLPPVLYVIYEKLELTTSNISKLISRDPAGPFKGYGLISLLSIIAMLFTAFAFGVITTDSSFFQKSYLSLLLTTLSLPIYIFALYCWYLTLLDGTIKNNYIDITRSDEDALSGLFSNRVSTRRTEQ